MTSKTLADVEAGFLQEFALLIRDINVTEIDTLQDAIAKSAYFMAEQRGFEPGHELPDWLEAEDEIKSMIASARRREAACRTLA